MGGGTAVTITGVNLANASSVNFGDKPATITANTPTSVTVNSPAGAGFVGVTVTTLGGVSNDIPFFYVPGPAITSVSATAGPTDGGNTVTINGFGLSTATSVNFGGNSATPTVINDGQLEVIVPAGFAGTVTLTVTTGGGTSTGPTYTYVDAPTVSGISPASGPTEGGAAVTIDGTNLARTTGVTFAGTPSNFLVINSDSVAAFTPPGNAGAVDVAVETAGGTATAVEGYNYVAGPGI
jgi:hypothetical protein